MPQPQNSTPLDKLNNTPTALEAVKRGYQPVPLVSGDKKARVSGWPRMRWSATVEGLAEVTEKFDHWSREGNGGIGVLVGAPSGNLVDIDLDHPKTARLKDHFLPRTAMRSGRPSRPNTHYWYIAEEGTLQDTRTYKLPNEREPADSRMIVEYRSTGGQTALPGNIHPTGELYAWGGEPWGGAAGPTVVNGRALALQVSLLGLCTLLVQYWTQEGGRHETYLALAGGLLRVGEGIHPYWERNASVIIGAIADATNDDEGPEGRISEVMGSTLKRLRAGQPVAGFGKLAELIGDDVVKQVRVILAEVESLAGVPSRNSASLSIEKISAALEQHAAERQAADSHFEEHPDELPSINRDPLEERLSTWEAVDLDPYLADEVQKVSPTVMDRADGQGLMYPGRLNMLYGPSESAKSWIAMHTCIQMIERGERVVYLDFEDEPVNTLDRMKRLGASYDDIRNGFSYVRPEDPLAAMQRSRWGDDKADERGHVNEKVLADLLEEKDPALIVADGMTVLYGLHGLDSNDSSQTDTITSWLKSLTRNGRSTVIVVDHTAKNPQRGSLPIGSQHKVAMIQGTLLQAYPVAQPMPGAIGRVELIVLKDRPGQVRAASVKSGEKAQLAAVVVIDSTHGSETRMALEVPSDLKQGGAPAAAAQTKRDIEIDLQHSRAAERATAMRGEEGNVLSLFNGDIERTYSYAKLLDLQYKGDATQADKRLLQRVLKRLRDSGEIIKNGGTLDSTYQLGFGIVEDEDVSGIQVAP